MSPIAEDDRAAAQCDGCGNIYTVNIAIRADIEPIGIPHCRDCGGSEFTVFGEHGEEIVSTSE